MKLFISRNQSSGMFGGVKFELTAKVELAAGEAEVIKKYKAEKEVLIKKEVKIPFTGNAIMLDITIGGLVGGQQFKCKDITEILETEKSIKEACEMFKNYISVMNSFGGQEVFEY